MTYTSLSLQQKKKWMKYEELLPEDRCNCMQLLYKAVKHGLSENHKAVIIRHRMRFIWCFQFKNFIRT